MKKAPHTQTFVLHKEYQNPGRHPFAWTAGSRRRQLRTCKWNAQRTTPVSQCSQSGMPVKSGFFSCLQEMQGKRLFEGVGLISRLNYLEVDGEDPRVENEKEKMLSTWQLFWHGFPSDNPSGGLWLVCVSTSTAEAKNASGLKYSGTTSQIVARVSQQIQAKTHQGGQRDSGQSHGTSISRCGRHLEASI